MAKRNIKTIILAISIVINLVTISSIAVLRYRGDDDEKDTEQIESEEKYNFGRYVLEYKEPIEIGNYTIMYSNRHWSIVVVDNNSNETLGHFWIRFGEKFGINEFQFTILESTPFNLTVEFEPNDKTDYLGYGVYFIQDDVYNKSFNFGGNETLFYRSYEFSNHSALFEVISERESYQFWLTEERRSIDLGFVHISGGRSRIECSK